MPWHACAGTGPVRLDVQAESFGGVGDLHYARDASVVVLVDTDEVRTIRDDEIDVWLKTSDHFHLENRRLQQLPQPTVCKGGHAPVSKRVLVPVVPPVVQARPTFQASAKVS